MARALVLGASGGIGSAVADELHARGHAVTRVSRRSDGFDVTDPVSVEKIISAIDGPFQTIFVAVGTLAAGGEPEKSLSVVEAERMEQVMKVNAIGPALILRHVERLLPREGRSVCAILSARVGSIGDNRMGGWYSYRASKAALNQIVHGAAIEIGRKRKEAVIVALHPGTVETPFTAGYAARHKTTPASEAAANLCDVMAGLEAAQSGGFFDYAGREVPW